MILDGDKWRKFQDEALKSLMFESVGNTLFLIKVINSFAPSVNWRVVKTSHRESEETYFAEYKRWRSDIDQEKFRSPVELLKHLDLLKPTIENKRLELTSEFVKNIMRRFYSINMTPFVEEQIFGLDDSTIEISFGGSFLNSKFSWWNKPPNEWKQLGDVVTDTLNYLDSRASF